MFPVSYDESRMLLVCPLNTSHSFWVSKDRIYNIEIIHIYAFAAEMHQIHK